MTKDNGMDTAEALPIGRERTISYLRGQRHNQPSHAVIKRRIRLLESALAVAADLLDDNERDRAQSRHATIIRELLGG